MINARFIKAEPTKDGITFILKAQKTKANMRLAVDLMDEECEISIKTKESSISFREPVADVMDRIHDVISDFYEKLTESKLSAELLERQIPLEPDPCQWAENEGTKP